MIEYANQPCPLYYRFVLKQNFSEVFTYVKREVLNSSLSLFYSTARRSYCPLDVYLSSIWKFANASIRGGQLSVAARTKMATNQFLKSEFKMDAWCSGCEMRTLWLKISI